MILQLLLVVLSLSQVFQADASDVYKQSFTFSDQTQFADLSVYNFDKGLSYTYQYLITARPNRQVTIHFLTNLMNNASLVLYDGVDATAPVVDISALYKIEMTYSELIAIPITSTGRSFYLEVTALTTNTALKQDFQAIATDIVQSSACGALVRAAGMALYFPKVTITVAPEGCIHIIRTVDLNNNKNANLRIQGIEEDVTTVVYKGLSENAVTYNAMNQKQTTMFITGDYYPARPIGATEKVERGYMFIPMFRVDSLKINFLSGIGNGNLVVSYLNSNPGSQNKTVAYTKANLPKSLTITEEECYQFLLSYSCTGTACTGMYGTVEDATNQ